MKLIKRTWPRRLGVVLLVLGLMLASTGIVLAQATANFDLGCRAVLSSGGGEIVHGATASTGALGQWAPGVTVGSAVGVRGGYIQPIPAQSAAVALDAAPAAGTQTNQLFIPLLRNITRLVRGCTY